MLLFDQNISYRIVRKIRDEFPGCLHVSKSGLPVPAHDLDIWDYAGQHSLMIVTFDEDYSNILTIKGAPPKVIWLRFGNSGTSSIAEKLVTNKDSIVGLASDTELNLLEIY